MEAAAFDLLKWGGGLLLIAAVKLLWDLNQKMGNSLARLEVHDGRIEKLEARMESMVSRAELLETLKRIELFVDNANLRHRGGESKGRD
jgi:hypothetical protein